MRRGRRRNPGQLHTPAGLRGVVAVAMATAASLLAPGMWAGTPADARFAGLAAQERRLTLESFVATLEVEPGGTLDVLEEMRFRFDGAWNGVFRTIPVVYDMDTGRHRIMLDIIDARDAAGQELRYETSSRGAYRQVRIWVPEARDVTHTVVLHYRARRVLRFFDTHDEIYWNVTGNEWEVPVQSATARVVLPDATTGRRATSYTGAYGDRGNEAVLEEIAEGFFFETTEPLGFREGLTVVVGWDPGVVRRPGRLELAWRAGWFLLLLPCISLGIMWRVWSDRGRDPARRPVNPRYEPPEGLTPAEAGTLVDHRPDTRDLTATIVHLAVRGYLRIEEEAATGLGRLWGKDQYTFRRLRPADQILKPHEREVLDGLFASGDTVSTKDLEHEFYKEIPAIHRAIYAELKEAGYYLQRPDHVLRIWVGVGITVLALGTVALTALAVTRGFSPVIGAVAGLGTGLPVLLFGFFMPARTVRGARRQEEVLGFEEFLDRVESDRFRRMITGPEQFEAYLPYAMAFGVEDRWARAFEGLYDQAPSWYVGSQPGSFRPTTLVSSLDSMSSRAGSAMTSAPRSSGGSGFSGGGGGGGFSGGGFGGGGGGGF